METTGTRTAIAQAPVRAVVRVQDYDRARHFYEHRLGLTVHDAEGPGRQGFAVGGDGTGFGFYERKYMAPPENTVVAFDVFDVAAAVHELQRRGVLFEDYDMPEAGIVTHDGIADVSGRKVAWFKDTEDNIFSVGCICELG